MIIFAMVWALFTVILAVLAVSEIKELRWRLDSLDKLVLTYPQKDLVLTEANHQREARLRTEAMVKVAKALDNVETHDKDYLLGRHLRAIEACLDRFDPTSDADVMILREMLRRLPGAMYQAKAYYQREAELAAKQKGATTDGKGDGPEQPAGSGGSGGDQEPPGEQPG